MAKWGVPEQFQPGADVPPRDHRPKCVHCGRNMPLHTEIITVELYDDPPPRLVAWRFLALDHLRECTVWTGRWGAYGDNRFCTPFCGWRWALDRAPVAQI